MIAIGQVGVELGKVMACVIAEELTADVAGTHDSSTTTLIERYRQARNEDSGTAVADVT